MKFDRILILSWVVLIFTVPWFFFENTPRLIGLPSWALYAIVSAAVYSIILFVVIEKTWQKEETDE
jgi:hypothetical protein